MISDSAKKILNIGVGSVLGLSGLALLLFSAYTLIAPSFHTQILKMLPAENFRILISSHSSALPLHISSAFASMAGLEKLPSEGYLVGYEEKSSQSMVYFTITPLVHNTNSKDCTEYNDAQWCMVSGSLSFLYSLFEMLESPSVPTLNSIPTLSQSSLLPQDASLTFLATTKSIPHFLSSSSLPLTPAQIQHANRWASSASNALPLFSGSITGNQYQLTFYKKEEGKIYPSSDFSNFSSSVLGASVDRYIMIKSPSGFYQSVFQNSNPEDFPALTEFSGWAQQKISDVFHQKLSWKSDILPLFTQDMLFYSSPEGASAIFSFPSEDLSKMWYERMAKILQEFAAQKVPTKKEHVLADGTKIAEVFPEYRAIEQKKNTFLGGESLTFSAPLEVNPKIFPVVAYLGSTLFVSENPNAISSYISPGMKSSRFVFPENTSVFFSAGIHASADEKLPVLFAEGVGMETKEEIRFAAKIDWNALYFISIPTEGVLETPFPTIFPAGQIPPLSQ